MAGVPDIAKAPPANPADRDTSKYLSFLTHYKEKMAANAFAYVNRQAMLDTGKEQKIKKVLRGAAFVPSAPQNYRPDIFTVETMMKYFVIHRPSDKPGASTMIAMLRAFSEPNSVPPAASHFLIGLGGELIQMVDLADEAKHCGTSVGKVFNYNSVGVELEGAIGSPVTDAQYYATAKLIRTLNEISHFLPSYTEPNFIDLARQKIVGHSEIAPVRKTDPGEFNYPHLISLIPRVTVSSDYYQDAFDPRTKIGENLQAILVESVGAQKAGELAVFSAAAQDAASTYRLTSLTNTNRSELAAWAAETSARVATALSEKMRLHMESAAQQSIPQIKLDPKQFSPLYNFKDGVWEA